VLTTSEAAALAGCGEETIRRWVRQGRLQARRDGPRLLIDREELVAMTRPASFDTPAVWRDSWLRRHHDWVARVRRAR
jgi:excisionase family DNA binding protein